MRRMPQNWVEKPPLNEIQPALHPLEVLFDVEKLMHGLSVSLCPPSIDVTAYDRDRSNL